MAVTYNIVYKNRDNPLFLLLKSTDEAGVLTYPDLTAGVTKVEILIKGVYYNSTQYPDAFDFATEGADGIVCLRLGNIPELVATKDPVAEIITYDPSNPDGLVWGTIPIKVLDLTGTEAVPASP